MGMHGDGDSVTHVPLGGAPWAEDIEHKTISMKTMCALLDVSSDTLRKYEALGGPHRYFVMPNGYRQFPYSSLVQLYELRSMVRAGAGTKEASHLVHGASFEEHENAVRACREENRRHIAWLEAVDAALARYQDLLDLYRTVQGDIVEGVQPEMWRLSCGLFARGLESREAEAAVRAWTRHMPAVFFCPALPLDQRGPDAILDVGVAIEAGVAEALRRLGGPLPWDDPDAVPCTGLAIEHIPQRKVLVAGVSTDDRLFFPNRTQGNGFIDPIEPVLEAVGRRGLRVTGSVVCRFIATQRRDDGQTADHYLVWVPVA